MSEHARRQLREYYAENGTSLLLLKVIGGLKRRIRDSFFSRRIGCSRFRLGRAPKVIGLKHLSIGQRFAAGDFLWLEAVTNFNGISYNPAIVIGDDVGLSDFVHIAATNRVVIGDGVLIGSRVLVTDHNHGEYSGSRQSKPTERPGDRPLSSAGTVTVGRNVWIGDGVAVLGGASIGDGSVIAANSVVIGIIPANCIAAGAPARPLKYFDENSSSWVKRQAQI